MGLLIDGQWHDQWYDTKKSGGDFKREPSRFHNWVTADGAPGPSGEGGFKAEPGRYRLYVSLACPWAHRTLIMRELKGLQKLIPVSTVHPYMMENGWEYRSDPEYDNPRFPPLEPLYGCRYHHQLYTRAQPDYSGRVTVPVLWDTQRQTIVSNESAELVRMFNSAFDALTGNRDDYYPQPLRPLIDRINRFVYEHVNNGVYRCGFATSQQAYRKAYRRLFRALDWLETHLSRNRYLAGRQITEADWRLFTTLVRFDPVYVGHFKANRCRIADYPALSGYLRELYQYPGIAGTVDIKQIKAHYYYSHRTINPPGIIPLGPQLDLEAPPKRDHL
ncbi:glutathione S-transferase family protein [Motiliproteus sp. SC1-56]|uniref:glutathione S-transferase family protein n=1 Tax=Motiliproteus sp. SC1-56 TaxID=2799565 RepID=UPI001A8D1C38|nr:glutathione S-transferase family protein [Motiliproteus sp. SC1-56]